jgi:cobalt-precorrin-5B (C1)-methyltransferase
VTGRLREGFTTGTAASAAAKAGVVHLLTGDTPATVRVGLPVGGELDILIDGYAREGDAVRAGVVKDAGDDPDVTHGARIEAVVSLLTGSPGRVRLDGGAGVGRATKPGLPVPVGEAAINPVPRAQIEEAVRQALDEFGAKAGAKVVIEVPDGERLAAKTLNPRLGILGGISILGTRGTVKPFSHEAYIRTIESCLRAARAQGADCAGFTTGGRSERLLREALPGWPEVSFVTVADYFAESMALAAENGFGCVAWGVFFGKLVKHAQGLPNTHAKSAPIDFDQLARWWIEAGGDPSLRAPIEQANTAMQVLGMIGDAPERTAFFELLTTAASRWAAHFSGERIPEPAYHLFDFSGSRLHVRPGGEARR